jgi:hypothetical protein
LNIPHVGATALEMWGAGEILKLNIWMGQTRILCIPWGTVKDSKDLNTRFWTSDTVFIPAFAIMAFSLTRAQMTNIHFCVSYSSHKYQPRHNLGWRGECPFNISYKLRVVFYCY